MKYLLALLMLSLSACATTGKYEEKLASWVGHDANDLIASWGMPTRTGDMPNGGKMYEYVQGNRSVANTTYNPYLGLQTTAQAYYCRTMFITDSSGRVTSWNWQGNTCVSY